MSRHTPNLLIVLLLPAVLCAGCAGGGRLALRSAEHADRVLLGNFNQGIYGFDDRNTLHVVLIEGEAGAPAQAVHVQMYWTPRAGRTPIDENATNATVHYIVFTGEGAGVYSGGGFLFPRNDPGERSLHAEVRNASLRLLDASGDFSDRLGLATASGGFRARRDDLAAQRTLRQIESHLRDRLGYPRFVDSRR